MSFCDTSRITLGEDVLRKLIVGTAKLGFGIFVVILVGCLISYIVSNNFVDFIDAYGAEAFMEKFTEFIHQFI